MWNSSTKPGLFGAAGAIAGTENGSGAAVFRRHRSEPSWYMFDFKQGTLPLLVSFPHSGTALPAELVGDITERGRELPDTDWFLPRLYDFEPVREASQIRADFSRYVIDPNRPIDGSNLYPGQPTPELCPLLCFDGSEIYRSGCRPTESEIERRIAEFWQPYHDQVRTELVRLRSEFGLAVLFDAHSIRSRVERLFPGQLPDINFGTARGTSCDGELVGALRDCLTKVAGYSHVIDGRFIGGYLTRKFGQPSDNVHAVQLELSQSTYMDDAELEWDDLRAANVQKVLQSLVQVITRWAERLVT